MSLFAAFILAVVVPLAIWVLFAVKRTFKYTEKNIVNALIEVGLTPLRMFRLGPFKGGEFDLDKSLRRAMKKAKLSDFGGTEFVTAYRAIMNNKDYKSQRFTNIGYLGADIELIITWVRRLKMIEYFKQTPEVLQVPVRSPVFVMGLPRTGTTFLHRLLSLDPAVRAPILWELLNSVPTVPNTASWDEKKKDAGKRKEHIRKLIAQRKFMGDYALQHIHEIGYDLPEECLMAMTDELPINVQFLYSCYVDGEDFLKLDSTNAYKHHRKVLQLLSHQVGETQDPRRWMLKCPIHLFYPREIAKAFPDAKLIWTHRHPISAVTSLCSLLKAMHQIYFEQEGRDDHKLGQRVAKISGDLLVNAPSYIQESGLPCSNIVYNNLVADPIGTVKSIYQEYGWTFTPQYEKILKDYLEENAKDRKKKAKGEVLHEYHPKEFGLTEDVLSTGKFKEYIDKYNVPMSRN